MKTKLHSSPVSLHSQFVLLAMLAVWLAAMPARAQTDPGEFTYTTNNGMITIFGYTGPGGDVSIPGMIHGLPVIGIWDSAFQRVYYLTNITIPDSVFSIGRYAFAESHTLAGVTIGNGVTTIGPAAFFRCYSLAEVTIGNSVTNIGDAAFHGCYSLTEVTIGNTVTSLGGGVFADCTNLTRAYFLGNAPGDGSDGSVFSSDVQATLYYLPGTTGWHTPFDGRPAVLWNPQVQTSDARFGMQPDHFGFTITGTADIPIAVEVCTNLDCPNWTLLHTCTVTNGSIYFCDEQAPNHPERYYRLRAP